MSEREKSLEEELRKCQKKLHDYEIALYLTVFGLIVTFLISLMSILQSLR